MTVVLVSHDLGFVLAATSAFDHLRQRTVDVHPTSADQRAPMADEFYGGEMSLVRHDPHHPHCRQPPGERMDFLDALAQHAFLQHALLAGVLASVACGVVGTYVVVRRITVDRRRPSPTASWAGSARPATCRWSTGWSWLHPLLRRRGRRPARAPLLIGLVSLRAREREDTVIGALWAVGMAVGVLLHLAHPRLQPGPDGLPVRQHPDGATRSDLWLHGRPRRGRPGRWSWLLPPAAGGVLRRGVRPAARPAVELYYLLLLCLTALTVVLLTSVVGIVLVIALLTLPVAIAGQLHLHPARHDGGRGHLAFASRPPAWRSATAPTCQPAPPPSSSPASPTSWSWSSPSAAATAPAAKKRGPPFPLPRACP